jgi:hypothetical protein
MTSWKLAMAVAIQWNQLTGFKAYRVVCAWRGPDFFHYDVIPIPAVPLDTLVRR